jgi:ABC-type phosphate/phosphonate transport system permease subunit
VLYFLKSNTRSAAIVGIVCAGCLVLHLPEMLRVLAVT